MPDAIKTEIETAATEPLKVKAGETEVDARPITEVIAADRYLDSSGAAEKKHRGLRFTKLVPPGAE